MAVKISSWSMYSNLGSLLKTTSDYISLLKYASRLCPGVCYVESYLLVLSLHLPYSNRLCSIMYCIASSSSHSSSSFRPSILHTFNSVKPQKPNGTYWNLKKWQGVHHKLLFVINGIRLGFTSSTGCTASHSN